MPEQGRIPRPPKPKPKPRALVIGAGVGGLTAAVALGDAGWQVTVLERAARVEGVGAGLGLTPNSLRALDTVGLGDTVRGLRTWTAEAGLRTPSGRWLSRTDAAAAAERFGGPFVPVHRDTLIGLLRSRLPEGALRTGESAELTDAGGPGGPARARSRCGGRSEEWEAELVVAADGIDSLTRAALFPAEPAPGYAGFTTWRAVVPAIGREFAPHETWGRGALWGSQPLADGRVYAYAAAAAPAGGHGREGELAELVRTFGGWHQPVPDLLAALADLPASAILRHDVYQQVRPLPACHSGRVALLGDAAHPMAPTLGQGGNQAIEDAVVLAQYATPGSAVPEALAAFTRERLPRTWPIVRRAARAARLITLTSEPLCALRDAAMVVTGRLAPHLALRALDGIADWSPRGHPYAARADRTAH